MNKEKQEFRILMLLSFVETWERFSFMGMRALLVLYLTSILNFSDHKTYSIFAIYAAIGYTVPVLAGIISDKLIGFQRTLIIGTVIMCIGHLSMFLSEYGQDYVFIGLSLVAVGTGFFKGNIHNLLANIHSNKDSSERDKMFSLFNISINLGGLIASISCGYVAHIYGWHAGFGLAGVGMLVGLLVFLKYRYLLGDNGLPPLKNIFPVVKSISFSIALIILAFVTLYYSDRSLQYFSYLGIIYFTLLGKLLLSISKERRVKVFFLILMLIFLIGFAVFQMQLGSIVNLFIQRNVDKSIFGYQVPTAVFQSINPFFVISFGLIFARIFAKYGYRSYIKRFSLGLFINIFCFAAVYFGCKSAIDGFVPLIYVVLAIGFISFAEISLYPMTKILFITLAPKNYKGFMMGFFMFGMSYANLALFHVMKFVSIPSKDLSDPMASLVVYEQGFFKITVFCIGLFLMFMLSYPILKRMFLYEERK